LRNPVLLQEFRAHAHNLSFLWGFAPRPNTPSAEALG
jgi:hypothetical protein